jgi:hypothetical protein
VSNTEAGKHHHVVRSSRPPDQTSGWTRLDECRSFYKTPPHLSKNQHIAWSFRTWLRERVLRPSPATNLHPDVQRPICSTEGQWAGCVKTKTSQQSSASRRGLLHRTGGRLVPAQLRERRSASCRVPRPTGIIGPRCPSTNRSAAGQQVFFLRGPHLFSRVRVNLF